MHTDNGIKYTWQLDLGYYNSCPQDCILDVSNFGFKLFPEQKQVLHLMRTLEQQESIIKIGQEQEEISYNKLRLGTPFSFGKMVVSLALIKSKNIPIARKWYSFFNNEGTNSKSNILELEIRRREFVDTTLVIVSPSMFHQWESHIHKCNIKALFINTLEDFDNLCVKLINKELGIFDLVLLVFRKLRPNSSLPLGMHYLDSHKNTNLSLLSILSIDKIWKRVIIDDFDTININSDLLVPCNIAWFISTTMNHYSTRNNYHTNNCMSTSAVNHRIMDIIRDPAVFSITITSPLRVNIPKIHAICYTFEYGRTINQVLNNLNYPIEVCEKINSGDISGAAAVLGLSHNCSSLGEFLYLLIYKNKQSYNESMVLCNKLQNILDLVNSHPDDFIRDERVGNDPFVIHYTSEYSWETLLKELSDRRQFLTFAELEQLNIYLRNCQENVSNLKHILERIKRNMEDGLCGKCYIEPEDDRFILQCCNIMLCKHCIIRNNDSHLFIDRCPNCTVKLDKNSFICMPTSVSLDDFLNTDFIESFKHLKDFNDSVPSNLEYNEDDGLLPKERALLKILKNKELDDANIKEKIGLNMKNIIESDQFIPQTEDTQQKYIIFTRWQSSASNISSLLNKRGISNIILKGTSTRQINRSIEKFRDSNNFNVMLIASHDICAGLNLEFATHLIFYHSIRNESVTAQLVGRAQRIGRKTSLKLISLENRCEVGMFNL